MTFRTSAQAIASSPIATSEVLRFRGAGMALSVAPTLFLMPAWQVACFAAAIMFIQGVAFPYILEKVARPVARTRPIFAVFSTSACFAASSLLVSAAWILASKGGEAGVFAGALAMATTFVIGMIYLSAVRMWFYAIALPGSIAWAIAPFWMTTGDTPWLMLIVSANLLGLMMLAWNDRNRLLRRVKLEAEHRQLAERASQEKSRFLAVMSHELRTPLNSVIGYAEILEEELASDNRGSAAADAARIARSGRHLLTLINEILDFSNTDSGGVYPVETDVAEALRRIVDVCRPVARANGNALLYEIDGALPAVIVDPTRLGQCVRHIVTNACKFTCNGSIVVRVARRTNEQATKLVVTVADTGCGIAPETLDALFTPFSQGDDSATRAHEGVGLGLALTRKLARLMGGDLTLSSKPGQGTTAKLVVPVEDAPASDDAVSGHRMAG